MGFPKLYGRRPYFYVVKSTLYAIRHIETSFFSTYYRVPYPTCPLPSFWDIVAVGP